METAGEGNAKITQITNEVHDQVGNIENLVTLSSIEKDRDLLESCVLLIERLRDVDKEVARKLIPVILPTIRETMHSDLEIRLLNITYDVSGTGDLLEPAVLETVPTGKKLSRISVLVLAANPVGSSALRLDEEIRRIEEGLRNSQARDSFELRSHWAIKLADFQELLLRYGPDIVHLSGHGTYDQIALENQSGEVVPVAGKHLGHLFALLADSIRCVILEGCYSNAQANAIAEHIDCVIGLSSAIGDQSSVAYLVAFYNAIGYGRSVYTAHLLGLNAIDLAGIDEVNVPKLLTTRTDPEQITF